MSIETSGSSTGWPTWAAERQAQHLRQPQWNRGDQIGRAEDVADRIEVRNRGADAALDPLAFHQPVDLAVAGAGCDDNMFPAREVGESDRGLRGQRMALTKGQHIALTEQALAEEAALQLRQQADGDVDAAGFHVFLHGRHDAARDRDPDAGRLQADLGQQRRQEVAFAEIDQPEHELALGARRIEMHLLVHRRADRVHRIGDRLRDLLGQRRRRHALCRAQEQFVAEQAAQPLQGVADRRLRDAQRFGRARHAALDHQLVEDSQQVEIKIVEIHHVCIRWRRACRKRVSLLTWPIMRCAGFVRLRPLPPMAKCPPMCRPGTFSATMPDIIPRLLNETVALPMLSLTSDAMA